MQKPILGHIDCPYCGAPEGVRIIHDKNGKPFGHCDDCDGQLRIGGKPFREKKFYSLYPWAAPKAAEIPVTVTETKTEPVATPAPVTVTPTATVIKPTKPKATFADALSHFGVTK